MNIEQVKTKFELLKKVNNTSYCLVSELAKELKVSKTDLMQFILDNNKLFRTDNINLRLSNGSRKNMGLVVVDVYLNADENNTTEEWVKRQTLEKSNYIYVHTFLNYGQVEGYFILIDDKEHSKHSEYIWRNTPEKIEKLKSLGVLHPKTFFNGGYSDYSSCDFEYTITLDELKKMRDLGWAHNSLDNE